MRILIADDDSATAEVLEQLLEDAGYNDILGTPAEAAAAACVVANPDLVLLGLGSSAWSREHAAAAVRELAPHSEHLPVLLVAEQTDSALQSALALQTGDFITLPIDKTALLLRVRNLLQIRQMVQKLRQRDNLLVRERTHKLEQARLETLQILASVTEYHDDETRQHAQRVGASASLIAQALELPDTLIARIRDAATLHDIGKIGVSRRVLLKPGALTPAERENMMRHVEIGARILAPARSPVLRLAAEIARTHHERWDGKGYAAGLAGEDIPLSGRITAVADVFDALTHRRPYREAWERDVALAEIYSQAGHQFDPRVVQAFATIDGDTLTASGPVELDELPPPEPEPEAAEPMEDWEVLAAS
jgi:response regulator RpfG family c-di-GMP phosphodiesterase